MKTHLWFNADEAGAYDIFCTEYCGVGHSHMLSKVIVMPVSDFESWYHAEQPTATAGQRLLGTKGCLACHTTDGTRKVGPTFKGLYGSKVTVVTNGKQRVVTADDAYIERSVLHPDADVVKGFPPVMPTIPVSKKEMQEIIGYMETLK
jgi:cytochrome c oxidase subunit 2